MKFLKSFLRDESGATAIEYGLIAAGVAVAIIVAVNSLGSNLNAEFGNVQHQPENSAELSRRRRARGSLNDLQGRPALQRRANGPENDDPLASPSRPSAC